MASSAAGDETDLLEQRVREQEQLIEQQQNRIEDQDRRLRNLEQRAAAGRRGSTSDDPSAASVTSGSPSVRLSISGQVDRAMNVLDDGDDTEVYHVDNDASNTRLRLSGEGVVDDDLRIVTRIEVALSANNSGQISQANQSGADRLEIRIGEVFVESRSYGRLSIGRGFSASDSSAEVDLSGTTVIAYSGFSSVVGGILFFDGDTDALSGVTLNAALGNLDGLGRENRVIYETPTLQGFQLAAGANTNDRYDAAIRWAGRGYGVRAAGAFGYAHLGSGDARRHRLSASGSVLHDATGLNLTLAAGRDERRAVSDAMHVYAKLGWLARLSSLGTTAFAVDYGHSVNLPTAQDEGHAAGAVIVQSFEEWGTEIYTQYRWFSLHRDGASFEELHAGSVGVRVKF